MLSPVEHVEQRDGEYYVTHTSVPVGVVIAAWKRNPTPEDILDQFPSLSLADVYGVVSYYLDHRPEMDAHFAQLAEEYERERLQEQAADPASYAGLRRRRDARRTRESERTHIYEPRYIPKRTP